MEREMVVSILALLPIVFWFVVFPVYCIFFSDSEKKERALKKSAKKRGYGWYYEYGSGLVFYKK